MTRSFFVAAFAALVGLTGAAHAAAKLPQRAARTAAAQKITAGRRCVAAHQRAHGARSAAGGFRMDQMKLASNVAREAADAK